jgi:hypothetical protein
VSDTGVFDTSDAVDEEDALNATGVAVDRAGAAAVLAVCTPRVPTAVRTPANVPSESSMVTIQETKGFRFMHRFCAGSLNRRLQTTNPTLRIACGSPEL